MYLSTDIALSPSLAPELASLLASLGNLKIAEREISQGARVYACTPQDAVDARLISRLPDSVELIAIAGTDTGRIDLDAARARGIKVSNTPAVSRNAALSLKANIAAFIDHGMPLDRV